MNSPRCATNTSRIPDSPYTDIAGFEDVYVEDGWVLGLESAGDQVRFFVEAVLTASHPLYAPALPGEQHSYARFVMTFRGALSIVWSEVVVRPIIGPDGAVDFGNIDTFTFAGTTYTLEGEWGRVAITAPLPPTLEPLSSDHPLARRA